MSEFVQAHATGVRGGPRSHILPRIAMNGHKMVNLTENMTGLDNSVVHFLSMDAVEDNAISQRLLIS